MSAVAKTIWMIESRFRDPPSLDEMAAHAGVSRFHLSRIFPIATGYSISSYIRARRLTEAAKALAEGAPDILDVALDAGYGSHEAFSRAFREQFQLTPDELRRRRSLNNVAVVEAIRMDPAQKITLAPPRIENQPAIRLAGLNQRYTGATMAGIPDQWTRFRPFIDTMTDGRQQGDSFAVVGRMEEGIDGFDYFCAIPQGAGVALLPGLTEMTLPAARYARIRHEGHISQIRATCAAAFDWLPTSGHEADNTWFSFLEYYGPDFDGRTGQGTVEVWIALKR
jgi:AraC family transcriptional regulator